MKVQKSLTFYNFKIDLLWETPTKRANTQIAFNGPHNRDFTYFFFLQGIQ